MYQHAIYHQAINRVLGNPADAAGEQAPQASQGGTAGGAAGDVPNPFDDPDLEGVAEHEVRQLHVCASHYYERTRDPDVGMMLDDVMTSIALEKLRKADLAAPHNIPRTSCWLLALQAASAGTPHDDSILADLRSAIKMLQEAAGEGSVSSSSCAAPDDCTGASC